VIICKVCGTQNEAGASFCGSCGSYLEWSGEAFNADGTPATPAAGGGAAQGGGAEPVPAPPRGPVAEPAAATPTGASPAPAGPAATGRPPAETVVCPVCGETNDPTRVFCRRCATELGVAAPVAPVPQPVAPEPPRGRSGPPVAVLGGIAAVAVIAIAAAIVSLPRGTPQPSSGTGTAGPDGSSPASSGPTASSSDGSSPSSAPAVSPTPAVPTGQIVFAASQDGNVDLWVWDATTGEIRSLVAAPGNQTDPAWSPDRSQVVYRDPAGLRIVNADGTPASPPDFTHHGEDRHPAWSPDGRTIVFSTNRSPLTSLDIYSRPADDNQVRITPLAGGKGDDWDPAWSPDSSTIVFASRRLGDARLFLMRADGSDERMVDLGPGIYDDPTISPDGEWLAFTRRDSKDTNKVLHVARIDGSGTRRMTSSDQNENDMTWSPDGRFIAVSRGGADARIVVIEVATGEEIATFGVDGAQNIVPDWR